MLGRLHKWVGAAMVMPLLVLAVSAPGFEMQCRALGVTMASCCCPKAKVAARAADGAVKVAALPSIKRESCCFIEKQPALPSSDLRAPSIGSRSDETPAPQLTADVSSSIDGLARPATAASFIERRAPRHGPSLLLVKRSFLI